MLHVSPSTSVSPSTGWIKEIDPGAFTIVFGHAGDGNLHVELHHEHTPDRRQELERLAYQITSEFGGSISTEHGIGIVSGRI